MVRFTVKEHKVWMNSVTGEKASIYGACPWITGARFTPARSEYNWDIVPQGYVICDNKFNTVFGTTSKGPSTQEECDNRADYLNRTHS